MMNEEMNWRRAGSVRERPYPVRLIPHPECFNSAGKTCFAKRQIKPVTPRTNSDRLGKVDAKICRQVDFDPVAPAHNFEIETAHSAVTPHALHLCRNRAHQMFLYLHIVRTEKQLGRTGRHIAHSKIKKMFIKPDLAIVDVD